MSEIALSTDINQIEFEIDYHKGVAGRSVWEIGRRLNHVKDNDLMHGEFMDWVEDRGIHQREANRLMKIARELPNSTTLSNLGETALYLIASLPEDEREKEHIVDGETKTPDEMTVRELQELKKELKRTEIQLKIAKDSEETKQKDIDRLMKKNNELVKAKEKVIEKEVIPSDYDATKQRNKELEDNYKMLEESYDFTRSQYEDLLEQRDEVNKKSEKYDQLTEAIERAEGSLTAKQELISNYKKVLRIIRETNDFLIKASGLIYMNIGEALSGDNRASEEFDNLILRTQRLADDLRKLKNNDVIMLEGEFTHE